MLVLQTMDGRGRDDDRGFAESHFAVSKSTSIQINTISPDGSTQTLVALWMVVGTDEKDYITISLDGAQNHHQR